MKKTIVLMFTLSALVLTPAGAAHAQEVVEIPVEDSTGEPAGETVEISVDDWSSVPGLSDEQLQAVAAFDTGAAATSEKGDALESLTAVRSKRATYYRGSALMWTRDNVDFNYNGSKITSTHPFQQAGYIFPNIARNNGISRYYNATANQRFRGSNTIGAGVVTPWGDVNLYSSDYIHRLSVSANGGWSGWSD